jgi:hypothetical protein
MVDSIFKEMSLKFESLYSKTGRPSVAPEKLLRSLLLRVLYTVRSKRFLMEQLDYNLLFRWFVGLSMDDKIWKGDRSSNSPDDPGNPAVDFKGEKRSNATHESTTDPDARLYKKAKGKESKLCCLGHLLMENRNGLAVNARVTKASGMAERDAAIEMLGEVPGKSRLTVGADKAYDTKDFVKQTRSLNVTPHVAQNMKKRASAIDDRTTRHAGYPVSQRKRKRVEEIFWWLKTVGFLRKMRHRGTARVGWMFIFGVAAYNLVRMRNMMEARA